MPDNAGAAPMRMATGSVHGIVLFSLGLEQTTRRRRKVVRQTGLISIIPGFVVWALIELQNVLCDISV